MITPIHYTQRTFASWSADGTRLAYRSTSAQKTAASAWSARTAATTSAGGRRPGGRPHALVVAGRDPRRLRRQRLQPQRLRLPDYDIYMASTAGGTGAPQKLTMTGDKTSSRCGAPTRRTGHRCRLRPGRRRAPARQRTRPRRLAASRSQRSLDHQPDPGGARGPPPSPSARSSAPPTTPSGALRPPAVGPLARDRACSAEDEEGRLRALAHDEARGGRPRAQAPPHPRGHRALGKRRSLKRQRVAVTTTISGPGGRRRRQGTRFA